MTAAGGDDLDALPRYRYAGALGMPRDDEGSFVLHFDAARVITEQAEEVARLRGIVVRDDGMVLACDFHLVLVASDGNGEAGSPCPACVAQAAESRLADATAQIKRMAEHQVHAQVSCDAERDAAIARIDAVRALCDEYTEANPDYSAVPVWRLHRALTTAPGEPTT